MIIEELIARLGFETKGLGDLKKFDKALEGAKKNLDGFGKAANKTIGNPLNPMSKMGTQAAQNAALNPDGKPKSQSQIAAEKMEAAKLSGAKLN